MNPALSQLKSHNLLLPARVLILAITYFSVAKLGLVLSFVLGHNTLVWPPTGIALAALLVFGSHLWPGITLGAFLASFSTGVPLAVACGVSAGNTLEALLAVFLLHRIARFHNALERLQDVFGLFGLAAGLSTMISATIDVASLCWGGVASWDAYGLLWRVWWLGGAMSNLVVAPLILTWNARPRVSRNLWRVAESGALLVSLFLVCHLLFGGWSRVSLIHSPLSYAVFPFIIWAALRFGQREAATVTFVVSTFALWGTAYGFGPFVRGTLPERLLFLYAFMSVAATTALVLAAIVSARKRAEEALQKSEQRYRTISELISDYAYAARLEPDGTYAIEWSTEAFTRITGFSLDEKLCQPESWRGLVHRNDLPIALARLQRLMSGQVDVSELRIITKSKEVRWVREYGRPVWDEEQNRVTRLYIAGHDITDRKLIEEALQDSEARNRSIIAAALDAVITMDTAGLITGWNPQAEAIFGWSQQEAMGRPLVTALIPLRYREAHERGLTSFLAGGKGSILNKRIEISALHRNGHELPVELTVSPIQSGKTWLFSAFARDLTDRKQAEEEREKLQEQLFQARKLEALGTLAGGVADDFNNILSAIMGFTELAVDGVAEGTGARRNLAEVLKASRRAKVLVQQILTFSQPLSQQKPEPIHPRPVIEVVTFLRGSLPQTIELRQHLDEAVGPVAIIPSQLRQVLTNLCHNAVQALGDKGGLLEVTLHQLEGGRELIHHSNLHPGPHLQLTVRDTGCGMPPEIQGRIFEPFFTTRPVGEGNGLGLAIVHGIVSGHGGAIMVDSAVGKGTTFQIYLPVSAAPPLNRSA